MAALEVKNLSFSYPTGTQAVKDVSFSLEEGGFMVLAGVSGSGKSTLMKLLKREIAPAGTLSGEMLFFGKALKSLEDAESAQQIGYVFQNPDNQLVSDTVWHELAFGPESMGTDSDTIRRRVAEMASFFGISPWLSKKTCELSGGQKQLLALASVMVMQPKVLLLDEPCSQLDPIASADFLATVLKINRELGVTVIMAEHNLEEVFALCDLLGIMREGAFVYLGRPEALSDEAAIGKMAHALPTPVKVFSGLKLSGKKPLDIRQGRAAIKDLEVISGEFGEEAAPQKREAAAELKDVYFSYGKKDGLALKGASLKVYRGENFVILGGNGSGKTTALSVMAALLKPMSGSVKILGRDVKSYKSNSLYKNCLTYLVQNPLAVFVCSTLRRDLMEVGTALGYPKEESEKEIARLAERLNLSGVLDRNPLDLSGGQQQKAALLKALLTKPKVLLLDEPTKGLDAAAKLELLDIVTALCAEGTAVITVTHDVEYAALKADRVALFLEGEVISVAPRRKFFAGNRFYTTASNRLCRGKCDGAVTVDDVLFAFGKKGERL